MTLSVITERKSLGRRVQQICVIVLGFMIWGDAKAESNQSLTALGWYERMLAEAPKALYQGIFVHQSGGHSQSVEIAHGMKQGLVWERLLHLDGPAREIIRKGKQLYCIHPDARVEQIDQQSNGLFAAELAGNANQLGKGYEFQLQGLQRVAGRPAMLVQLRAKDALRHNYQLWLDTNTFVPLRTELVSQKGELLERYQFSYFAPYTEWNESLFAPRTKGVELVIENPEQVDVIDVPSELGWKLNWMPDGFMQRNADELAEGEKGAGRRMYSDGIVMFSVFVEPVSDAMKEGLAQVGATVLAVQHKQWQGQTHRITVVGEIPGTTATRIAQSVELM